MEFHLDRALVGFPVSEAALLLGEAVTQTRQGADLVGGDHARAAETQTPRILNVPW